MTVDRSAEELRRLAPDLAPSISKLTVPAYVLDHTATVRWMNRAAIEQFGDMRGKRTTQIVEPAYAAQAREQFAAKMIGTSEATEATADIRTADGRRVAVDISSAQLVSNGTVVGVFGLADPTHEPTVPAAESPQLTPRQLDVLRYLAAGRSTAQIAARLGISNETVRNHVRGIMQRLGVHSRLEAVLRAHQGGLV